MADMQVLCFNSDFKKQFDSWKANYERDSQNLTSQVEAKNPMLQSNLTEIDKNIAALKSKAASVLQDTQTATSDVLHQLESERNNSLADQAKSSKACDEYIQITQTTDQKIKELEAGADKIRSDQAALTSDTLTKINQYIVQAQLTVPKLDGDATNDLFELETGDDEETRPDPSSWGGKGGRFLVDTKPHIYQSYEASGQHGTDWFFLLYVPIELEGTQIDPVIKAAYQKWITLKSALASVTDQEGSEKTSEDQRLIPWENLYGISRNQGDDLIVQQGKLKGDIKQLDGQLDILKTGGKEANDLVQAAITTKIAEINQAVASLNEQRKNAVEEASETANAELKAQSRSKFYELLKNQTMTAVRTGSKGDFIIPGNTAYIYADAQRDNGEKLAWLVRADPSIPSVKLSVSNTASEGGDGEFDEFWMLKVNLD